MKKKNMKQTLTKLHLSSLYLMYIIYNIIVLFFKIIIKLV